MYKNRLELNFKPQLLIFIMDWTLLYFILIIAIPFAIENIALHQFFLPVFKTGVPIYRKVIHSQFSNWNTASGKKENKYGIYLFDSLNKKGYFIVQNKPQNNPFYSLLPHRKGFLTIFGTITEYENRVEIVFKLSIRTSLIIFLWTLAWLIIPISGAIKQSDPRILVASLVGLGFTFAVLHVAHMILSGKFLLVHDEIVRFLRIRVEKE